MNRDSAPRCPDFARQWRGDPGRRQDLPPYPAAVSPISWGDFSEEADANDGWAWSRYQPNARSTIGCAPISFSASASTRGGSAGIRRCSLSARANALPWPALKLAVARQRVRGLARALHHRAQLAPAGDAEVERGADALARQREAVAGGVADEVDAVLGRVAQGVGEPVALVAHGVHAQAPGQLHGRLLDVLVRVVRPRAHPLLALGRDAPAVAAAHQRPVHPYVEVGAAAVGVHLQAAGERRLRWLVAAVGQHAPPAQGVDDLRCLEHAAVGDHVTALVAALDLRDLEPRVALGEQEPAQLAVVERGPAPGQPVARAAVRGVEGHVGDLLADGAGHAHRLQPRGGGRAGRGLALADLVTVHDQHVRARPRELAGHRQPGEAGAADQHVGARRLDRGALGTAQGGPDCHRRSEPTAAPATSHGASPARRPRTS